MAMENRTGIGGLGLRDKAAQLVKTHQKLVGMVGAAAAGYVMAGSHIFGGVAPFGVAFCAVMPSPFGACAALGTVLGYTFSANPLTNMKYLAAVVLAVMIRWLFGGRLGEKYPTAESAITALLALGIAGGAMTVISNSTLYEAMLTLAEVFLCAGAAYFFSRTLLALEAGWSAITRSDVSCMIITFAVLVMGLAPVTVFGISVGRVLSVLVVLLCARAGNEAGGAVAGITAGIAMGLSGGDYAYTIAAYGFGGLMAGVFAGLGRIATAGSYIVVNTVAALFTKSTGDVYTVLLEVAVASVLFVAVPQSVVVKFKLSRMDRTLESEASAQGALRGRLGEISGALRDIGVTTREVSQRLGKLEQGGVNHIPSRVADRVCAHCGMKTTCWQFEYSDTMNAMNDALGILKRQGTIGRTQMPKHFADKCCKLEDFLAELNIQFGSHVAKEGVQRKVSRVREVVTDQFEGMAMLLEELSGELCAVTLLDAPRQRKVRDYFEREGFAVQQVRCFADDYDRITAEITLPAFEVAKLEGGRAALDLSTLLEAEFDQPYVSQHRNNATAVFTEKAAFVAEMGVYQIPPGTNKLCGDAYECILNRSGKAHFVLSDGMGSGGSAAVDANMAAQLITRLISVGFSHEAALKMVNSALLIKSGEESLATLDICTVDLFTGHADFYKAGAAPTFVIRGGRAGYVESTSLPAGILQGVSFDKSSLTLKDGDVVAMISDGVVATGSDWVKSELAALDKTDMQRLAEKLAMIAKTRRTDGREDDITVIAVALRKGI